MLWFAISYRLQTASPGTWQLGLANLLIIPETLLRQHSIAIEYSVI